jgi:hypothetical protein
MGSHDPFGYFKHKLWPKEGPRIKLAICLPTIKRWESPWFPYMQVAWHILFKSSWWGYNFSSDIILIRGMHIKLWACKIPKVPNLGISRLLARSPGTKWHLGASLMSKHKIYYKGEGGGFPQVWALVSLMNMWLLVVHPCTKMLQLRTNQLVVWFVQVCVTKWIVYQSSYSHFGTLACPSTPKVLQAKERTPTHYPYVVFTFGLNYESIKELGVHPKVLVES